MLIRGFMPEDSALQEQAQYFSNYTGNDIVASFPDLFSHGADLVKYCIDNDVKFNESSVTQTYKVDGQDFDLEIARKTLSEVLLTLEAKHQNFSKSYSVGEQNVVDYIRETKPLIKYKMDLEKVTDNNIVALFPDLFRHGADLVKYCIDNDVKFNKSTATQNYKVDGQDFDLEIAGKKVSEVLLSLEAKHPNFSKSYSIGEQNVVDYIKETKPEIAKQQEEEIALIKSQLKIAKEIVTDYNKRHGLEEKVSKFVTLFKTKQIKKQKALASALAKLENAKDKEAMHKAIDQFKEAAKIHVHNINPSKTTASKKQAENLLRQ